MFDKIKSNQTKANQFNQLYTHYLFEDNRYSHVSPKGISDKQNLHSLIQDLNLGLLFHFLRPCCFSQCVPLHGMISLKTGSLMP